MQALQMPRSVCSCSSLHTAFHLASSGFVGPAARHIVQAVSRSNSSKAQGPGVLLLSAAAGAMVLQVCLPTVPAMADVISPTAYTSSAPSSRLQPLFGDMSLASAAPALAAEEEEEPIDEYITEQVALPPELLQFMEMLEKGAVKDVKKLQEARRTVGFDRSADGRVFLYTEDGEPFQVRADMGVPGMLLLRDAGGYCYYLPASDTSSLQQIDLSDDAVVAQLFANHAWEELVEPLETIVNDIDASKGISKGLQDSQQQQEPAGRLQQLRLTEREFRTVVSLLANSQELPEEPLDDLADQEGQ